MEIFRILWRTASSKEHEHVFEIYFCNFDEFKAFLLNKSINFFKKKNLTDPKLLNSGVYLCILVFKIKWNIRLIP